MNVTTDMAKDWFGGYHDREQENSLVHPRTTQFGGTMSLTF